MSEASPGHRPKRNRKPTRQTSRKNRAAKRTKPGADPAKTGRALRQTLPTPSTDIDDIAAAHARLASTRQVVNGDNATGNNDIDPVFESQATMFPDRKVAALYQAFRHSGLDAWLDNRINDAKRQAANDRALRRAKTTPKNHGAAGGTGRPTEFPIIAILVALVLTAEDGKGCLATEVARTLYERMYPTSQRLLGIPPLTPEAHHNDTTRFTNDSAPTELTRRERWRAERRVRLAMHRIFTSVDPSIHPKGHAMPWTKMRELDRPLTEADIEERMDALSHLCNSLLHTPLELLPVSVRSKMRSAGIDGTPMKAWARGRGVDNEEAATDPDPGYYARGGDHSEDSPTKAFFAFDINLMTVTCDSLTDRQYLPTLPLAMTLNRPGVDPSGAARRMFGFLRHKGWEPGYLAGDGLYANAEPDKFMQPARQAGWKLVLPILEDDLGLKGTVLGFLLIEGALYCPSIPSNLITATIDFRNGNIDLATYLERIHERQKYRARLHDSREGRHRFVCPAGGKNPALRCAWKPESDTPERTYLTLGKTRRLRDQILPNPDTKTDGIAPEPCRTDAGSRQTLNLRVWRDQNGNLKGNVTAARLWQDLTFGTVEHTATYNALRQAQEGLHGFAKDDAHEALGTPGKRRIKGIAAQSLFAAVLLTAASLRKIRAFLKNARRDANGDYYVPRRKRKGEHATTNYPPGSPGVRGDPDYDNSPHEEEAA